MKPSSQQPTTESPSVGYRCQDCLSFSTKPGRCGECGAEMTPGRLMSVSNGMAQICNCPETCTCTTADENDPSRCTCGEPVTEVSLEGKYQCSCGIPCPSCSPISDSPGECECGEERELVE